MKFSIKNFFTKSPQIHADLVTFTEEIYMDTRLFLLTPYVVLDYDFDFKISLNSKTSCCILKIRGLGSKLFVAFPLF